MEFRRASASSPRPATRPASSWSASKAGGVKRFSAPTSCTILCSFVIQTGVRASAWIRWQRVRRGSSFSPSTQTQIGSFSRRIFPLRSAAASGATTTTTGSSSAKASAASCQVRGTSHSDRGFPGMMSTHHSETHATPAPRLFIRGGHVLDLDRVPHRPGEQDILIENGRIVAITDAPDADPAKADGSTATVVDARGKLVVPGFVNAHYHSHDVFLKGCFDPSILEYWVLNALPRSYPPRSNEEIR